MPHQCEIDRGLTVSRLMLLAVCFQPRAVKGNSFVVLDEPSGVFQSPGYPDLDDDMECTWKVVSPPHHKIVLMFLDFDLVERNICKDEVEVHGGDVNEGPYIGHQLNGETITSTSNTISVILRSCGTSLFSDRRGIQVSYTTVYPTTLDHQTSNRVSSTLTITPSTHPNASTVNRAFSTFRYPVSSHGDATVPTYITRIEQNSTMINSGNNGEQSSSESSTTLVLFILPVFLVSILILIIITVVIVQRRRAKGISNASIALNQNNEISGGQPDILNTHGEGREQDNSHLEYDYVQRSSTVNVNNGHVVRNTAPFPTKMSFPKLNKKQPVLNANSAVCHYENNTGNLYDNTDFDQEYGTASCTINEKSPKIENADRQLQRKHSNTYLDEGLVENSAYEPYVSQK